MIMKKLTVSIIGCGNRGYQYGSLMKKREEFEIVAVCDHNSKQVEKINQLLHLPKENTFLEEREFFVKKRSDLLVLATCDTDHVRQCIRAMELGYDVLLEKPISDNREEIDRLLQKQKETGCRVIVCHVLRYSVWLRKLDELLKSGVIGNLLAVDHMERVQYWHFVQAYVRMHKLYFGKIHPTILAKCCHDLDLIQHFAGSKCTSVTSVGGLRHFRPENAPEGATQRCVDCPNCDTCTYSAKKIYIDEWIKQGCPEFRWPWNKIDLRNPNTQEGLYRAIREGVYGECVFGCETYRDVHAVDHQMVQMQFENGVIASLKMVFGALPGRRVDLYGTEGQITFDEIYNTIEVKPYIGAHEVIAVSELSSLFGGHGGGDEGLISDLYEILSGKKTEYTSIEESLESHLIGICAEESRINGGMRVFVHGS